VLNFLSFDSIRDPLNVKKILAFGIGFMVLLAASVGIFLNQTVRENSMDVPVFSPIQDDALARKYAPRLVRSELYGNPTEMLYRASKHDSGNTHITYHLIWDGEENTGKGWKPLMSRWIYTGGLGIQKIMFGKKDIEQVSLVINPKGDVTQLLFETAENYSDTDFGVKHKTVVMDGKFKHHLVFDVISWNHLFELTPENDVTATANLIVLEPAYFTEELWQNYTMVKREEKFLSRNRAHQDYEREFVQ
jgi:hypothetical protein